MNPEIFQLSADLGGHLYNQDRRLVTVESCTGGGIAYAVTAIAGSSDWFDRSLVTYTNQSKMELAGVPEQLLTQHGAVSEPVARAMALGGLAYGGATDCVAVTGIAGPDGGSTAKPVGTVWFGWANRSGDTIAVTTAHQIFSGNRDSVREQAIAYGLSGIIENGD